MGPFLCKVDACVQSFSSLEVTHISKDICTVGKTSQNCLWKCAFHKQTSIASISISQATNTTLQAIYLHTLLYKARPRNMPG